MNGIIKGFENVNVGCSHEEMIPNWLGITIWGGEYEGLNRENNNNGVQLYKHKINGGYVINHNVTNGLPFKNNSISNIYNSHFIEHLYFDEAKYFLKESYRVLKKDGIIRIICPDLLIWISKLFLNNDQTFFDEYKKLLDIDYWENYIYKEHKNLQTNSQIFNSMIFNWGHKWMWDYESLEYELSKIGFSEIKKKKFMDGDIFDLNNIETALSPDKIKARNLESMFIEAKK